jgi:hypothetical protein
LDWRSGKAWESDQESFYLNKHFSLLGSSFADSFFFYSPGIASSEIESRGEFKWVYKSGTLQKPTARESFDVKILRLNSSSTKVTRQACISLLEWVTTTTSNFQFIDQDSRAIKDFLVTKNIS